MFEFSVSKDTKKQKKTMIRWQSREGSGTFMSNTNCEGIEN